MNALGKTLAVAAAIGLTIAPAAAQQLNSGASGTYGQVRLRSGFEPDPHNVTVNAGGPYDASRVDSSCRGFIATRASFSLNFRAGDRPLHIGAVSDADTTIVVRAPDSSWRCDDDSGGNLNPSVSWDHPLTGRYQIWVGRFGVEGESSPATLHISEVSGPSQSASTGGPDFTLDPSYGAVSLVAGFEPDPHTQTISAGGSIDASSLGQPGCVGFIAREPDYRVNWTAGSSGLPLIFSVAANADTTLVINDAQGNWVCDDDSGDNGLNPSIRFEQAASGQYDVWVGTYSSGGLQDSTLHVSEVSTQ
ncbi:MAG: hypothetical protein ACREH4_11175 [Vitreimonas sp.]